MVPTSILVNIEIQQALNSPYLSDLQKAHLDSLPVREQINNGTLTIDQACTRTARGTLPLLEAAGIELIRAGASPEQATNPENALLGKIIQKKPPEEVTKILKLSPEQVRGVYGGLSVAEVESESFLSLLDKLSPKDIELKLYIIKKLKAQTGETLETLASLERLQLLGMFNGLSRAEVENISFLLLLNKVAPNKLETGLSIIRKLKQQGGETLETLLSLERFQLLGMSNGLSRAEVENKSFFSLVNALSPKDVEAGAFMIKKLKEQTGATLEKLAQSGSSELLRIYENKLSREQLEKPNAFLIFSAQTPKSPVTTHLPTLENKNVGNLGGINNGNSSDSPTLPVHALESSKKIYGRRKKET